MFRIRDVLSARNSSSIAACGERINLCVVCLGRLNRLHPVAPSKPLRVMGRASRNQPELFFMAGSPGWANQPAVYSK